MGVRIELHLITSESAHLYARVGEGQNTCQAASFRQYCY